MFCSIMFRNLLSGLITKHYQKIKQRCEEELQYNDKHIS